MPGEAVVTINDNQWSVSLATTSTEFSTGLSGMESIPAGTGMLFILPTTQVVIVDTTQMLFPIDIVFIKDDAVLSIASDISPGYLVEEATPCDMFLEVNAGEAALVEVDDIVVVTITQEPGFDISSAISFALPLMVLAFVFGMLGGMVRSMGSGPPTRTCPLCKAKIKAYPGANLRTVAREHYAIVHFGQATPGEEEKWRKFYDRLPLPRGSSSKKRIGSGNPDNPSEAHPVHCVTCGWEGSRTHGPLKSCPKCDGVVVWTFTGKTKPTFEYYWEIHDLETGEKIQKGKPYTTGPKALAAARSYQRGRSGEGAEHRVVIRIYDSPNMEEWGRTIRPMLESGMSHGAPRIIGKTPLQREALDKLWPYFVMKIHDDEGLTVSSGDKEWIVTTEGGTFVQYRGEEGYTKEEILGEAYSWTIHGWETGKTWKSPVGYLSLENAMKEAKSFIEAELKGISTTDTKYVIHLYDKGKMMFGYSEHYIPSWIERHSIHGEPRRRLVEQYGTWAVGRAEAICPEGDIVCVTREAKRLIETIRSRYGEGVKYVTITDPGRTVLRVGDTVSVVVLEKENKRVEELGWRGASWRV